MKALMVILAALFLAGCDSYSEGLAKDPAVKNVREAGRGYLMYEIENGTVTCREHKHRSELTCWANGK